MREMKDSGVKWVGEIPSSWKVYKVKQIADSNNDVLPENYEEEQEIDYIEIGSVTYEDGVRTTEKMKFGNAPSRARRIVHNGDTIISTVRTYLKAIAYIDDSLADKIVSTGFSVVTPHKDVVAKFLYYALSTHSFISNVEAHSVGISYPAINNTNLMDLKIVLPMQREQIQIASYLDAKCSKIDEIIEKQQAIIEKLKEYKLSIITEAVTKGLNPDVEMKDSGNTWFGYIPAHWDCVISRFVFEKVSDINHFMPESIDSGYPYLMIGDLKEHISDIDFENCKKISKMDFDCLKQKMKSQKGDVIFARYATIGTVCYVDIDIDFLVSYACVTVRPNKELYGEYLYYYFKSCAFRENVKQFINSNTQENVGIEALCKTKITIPPYKEQKMIVNYLNEKSKNIDISIEKKRNIVEKLQEYKKSIIYEVVTGKKEV